MLDPWCDWPTWIATSPFVPEDERPDHVKPEFLKKAATMETLDWLPKIQAKKFRWQQNLFESNTPKPVKEKLRAAVPQSTPVVLYKTVSEFTAPFRHGTNLDWIKHELRALPEKSTAPARAIK